VTVFFSWGPNRGLSETVLVAIFVATSVITCAAARETVLHGFDPLPHGANPQSMLVADAAGNLYGTTQNGGGYGVVFKLTPNSEGGWTETSLHQFRGEPQGGLDGAYPAADAALVFDSKGNLYGTTSQGGIYGQGTIFVLAPGSGGKWKETVIHHFAGYPADGSYPNTTLLFDSSGNLYGTTSQGGSVDVCGYDQTPAACGAVFELSPAANGEWSEKLLYSFQGNQDGCLPSGGLTFDQSGNLYGTTVSNGGYGDACAGNGTAFELSPGSGGTWTESVIVNFNNTDAAYPTGGMVFDSGGNLYGGCGDGPARYPGGVFELTPTQGGWTEQTIHNFNGESGDGSGGVGNLVFDSTGNLYGITVGGGTSKLCDSGCGTVFELLPGSGGWTENVLYSFGGAKDGATPTSIFRDSGGNLYTTASTGGDGCYNALGCGAVFELVSNAQGRWTGEVLYDFPAPSDGSYSYTSLVSDHSGNFYGTTEYGGSPCSGLLGGCGTVFKLSPLSGGTWKKTLIYNFTGNNGDGAGPLGDLIVDHAGNLYGTTQYGGNNSCSALPGCGTVFKLSPSVHGAWRETVIYRFSGNDGFGPMSGLVMDHHGSLYGTTLLGGSLGAGVAFQLVPETTGSWTESILYNTGGYIQAGLILDSQGNLYGATVGGGSGDRGEVFQLTHGSSGWIVNVLYSFSGSDGAEPKASLLFDQDGNLYGTTMQGGRYDGGTVFELTPGSGGVWTEMVLHDFVGVNGDGAYPEAELIFDLAGNLYGTTTVGGANGGQCSGLGCGTAFELKPAIGGRWRERILHRFTGGPDGGQPYGGLTIDSQGSVFGATSRGGNGDQGTVFVIKP
jgi:uncharacterized repeat protein (TIGR03803 family)